MTISSDWKIDSAAVEVCSYVVHGVLHQLSAAEDMAEHGSASNSLHTRAAHSTLPYQSDLPGDGLMMCQTNLMGLYHVPHGNKNPFHFYVLDFRKVPSCTCNSAHQLAINAPIPTQEVCTFLRYSTMSFHAVTNPDPAHI
jgi:hypothetical protein